MHEVQYVFQLIAVVININYYFCSKSFQLSGRTLRKLPFLAHALYSQVREVENIYA